MMRDIFSGISLAVVVAVAFPISALADVSKTAIITSGQNFSFDTGTTSASGGDIAFDGTSINFVGGAAGYNSAPAGASASTVYGSFTSGELASLPYATTSITGSSLVPMEVFAVKTNGGNCAKVLVGSVNTPYTLVFTYTAYGVTASNAPTISAVLDAGRYTANIAQGSYFVVKGTNLSAAGYPQFNFPLPRAVGGVLISFTSLTSGTAAFADLAYLYNENGVNQLAAVLPSSVATGTYNVTVQNNAGVTSAPFTVQVVARKPGLITADSTGSGLVVTQNYVSATELDVNRFTTGMIGGFTVSPAHLGQVEIAYLVGSGADPGSDDQASAGYNFLANGVSAQVIVGGTTIQASYLGRVAGGSGYEQINFTLPAKVTTGCTVPFQVVENGVASQMTFISIAPSASATACVQPGFTTTRLQAFDNGFIVSSRGFSLSEASQTVTGRGTSEESYVSGLFAQYTGFELAALSSTIPIVSTSGCTVTQFTPTSGLAFGGSGIALDAGKVTLTGPTASGLNGTPLAETSNSYDLTINGTNSPTIGTLVAGTYTLSGAGGTSVGPFSVSLNPSPLTVTGGLPSTVTRSAGLSLNWTGGNSSELVEIFGISGAESAASSTGASFICFTTAGANSFTVPSSVLSQLSAISAAQVSAGTGETALALDSIATSTFNPPLVGGGTIMNANFGSSFWSTNTPAYQ